SMDQYSDIKPLLANEDLLFAQSNGVEVFLNVRSGHGIQENIQLNTAYSASFENPRAGDEFLISFLREKKASAVYSVAVLPDDFTIEYPEDGATFQRDQEIKFMWTPGQSGQEVKIEVTSYCDSSTFANKVFSAIDGDGIVFLGHEDFYTPEIMSAEDDCLHQVTIDRMRHGVVDENFASGYFHAIQRRSVLFFSVVN